MDTVIADSFRTEEIDDLPQSTSLDDLEDLEESATSQPWEPVPQQTATSESAQNVEHTTVHTDHTTVLDTQDPHFPLQDIEFSRYKGGTIKRKKKLEVTESQATVAPENPDELLQSRSQSQVWIDSFRRSGFAVGFCEDKNKRYRRTMEDAHTFVEDFNGVTGQGWFAIYDGHAGKRSAEYCGETLHQNFANLINEQPTRNTPQHIPELLHNTFTTTDNQLDQLEEHYSGCTAIVAFIGVHTTESGSTERVLYTANVGDARAVLCRGGGSVRLSYDHKASDPAEVQRIVDAGGFVMHNRVNGTLAVSRALGDHGMKEFVIGDPYTTATTLTPEDSFIIIACDGLWDVCTDDEAVDLIKDMEDPQAASQLLLEYALDNLSTDNLSIMVVKLNCEWKSPG